MNKLLERFNCKEIPELRQFINYKLPATYFCSSVALFNPPKVYVFDRSYIIISDKKNQVSNAAIRNNKILKLAMVKR